MKGSKILLLVLALATLAVSCKKEKESRTIITTYEEPVISKDPKVIGDTIIRNSFEWSGMMYSYSIGRKADKRTVVKDDDGQKYYDNKVTLTIEGPSDVIFEKTFSKADFSSYIDSSYVKPKRSALKGLAFNRVEHGGHAVFVATVGSPDIMSDEFMSVQISIGKNGDMAMAKLQDIDDDEIVVE